MKKSRILYRLLAAMLVLNLALSAVFVLAEATPPVASPQPSASAPADDVDPAEATPPVASPQPSASAPADAADPAEATPPVAGPQPSASAPAEATPPVTSPQPSASAPADADPVEATPPVASPQPSASAPADDAGHTTHTCENGVCTLCGYVHEHTLSAGDVCEICSYKPEAVLLYQAQAAQVNVDVTWTAMSFTCTAGQWDPATHSYSDGSWQPTENGGVITVKNNGSVAAKVSLTFTSSIQGVGGSFTPNNVVTVAPSNTETIRFTPTGKPEATFTEATLGSISVNVQAVSPSSVASQPERNDPT